MSCQSVKRKTEEIVPLLANHAMQTERRWMINNNVYCMNHRFISYSSLYLSAHLTIPYRTSIILH